MYPHERSLVERMKNNSFAIVGVNSDAKERLSATKERENITWRSFWDGGSTGGPIASRWNVRSWPTTYVLDVKGTIRYKNVRGKTMDAAVETLLTEAGEEFPSAEGEDHKKEAPKKADPAPRHVE